MLPTPSPTPIPPFSEDNHIPATSIPAASKSFAEIKANNEALSEIDPRAGHSRYGEYDINITPRSNQTQARASNQGALQTVYDRVQQTIPNFTGGLVESAGWLYELPSVLMGQSDYTNAAIELGEGIKKWGKEGNEIYRENPNKGFDATDSAFWIDNLFSGAESVAEFGLTGFGVGSVATKGAKGLSYLTKAARLAKVEQVAEKISDGAKAMDTARKLARGTVTGDKLLQGIAQGVTSVAVSFVEGGMAAKEAGNAVRDYWTNPENYKKLTAKAKTQNKTAEQYRDELVQQTMNLTAGFSTGMNFALNLTSFAPLFKTKNVGAFTKQLDDSIAKAEQKLGRAFTDEERDIAVRQLTGAKVKSEIPTVKLDKMKPAYERIVTAKGLGIEAVQEGVEELNTEFATQTGKKTGIKGDSVDLVESLALLKNYGKEVATEEGFNAFFWGALMGSMTKPAMEVLSRVEYSGDTEKQAKLSDLISLGKTQEAEVEALNAGYPDLKAYQDALANKKSIKFTNPNDYQFKKAQHDLIKDFERIDEFNKTAKELEELNQPDVAQAYRQMAFTNGVLLNSVRNGNAKYLVNDLVEIANVDNFKDLGQEAQNKADDIEYEVFKQTEFGKTTPMTKEAFKTAKKAINAEPTSRNLPKSDLTENAIVELEEKLNEYNQSNDNQHSKLIGQATALAGQTEAMFKDLAIDNKDMSYKERANNLIQKVEARQKDYENLQAMFSKNRPTDAAYVENLWRLQSNIKDRNEVKETIKAKMPLFDSLKQTFTEVEEALDQKDWKDEITKVTSADDVNTMTVEGKLGQAIDRLRNSMGTDELMNRLGSAPVTTIEAVQQYDTFKRLKQLDQQNSVDNKRLAKYLSNRDSFEKEFAAAIEQTDQQVNNRATELEQEDREKKIVKVKEKQAQQKAEREQAERDRQMQQDIDDAAAMPVDEPVTDVESDVDTVVTEPVDVVNTTDMPDTDSVPIPDVPMDDTDEFDVGQSVEMSVTPSKATQEPIIPIILNGFDVQNKPIPDDLGGYVRVYNTDLKEPIVQKFLMDKDNNETAVIQHGKDKILPTNLILGGGNGFQFSNEAQEQKQLPDSDTDGLYINVNNRIELPILHDNKFLIPQNAHQFEQSHSSAVIGVNGDLKVDSGVMKQRTLSPEAFKGKLTNLETDFKRSAVMFGTVYNQAQFGTILEQTDDEFLVAYKHEDKNDLTQSTIKLAVLKRNNVVENNADYSARLGNKPAVLTEGKIAKVWNPIPRVIEPTTPVVPVGTVSFVDGKVTPDVVVGSTIYEKPTSVIPKQVQNRSSNVPRRAKKVVSKDENQLTILDSFGNESTIPIKEAESIATAANEQLVTRATELMGVLGTTSGSSFDDLLDELTTAKDIAQFDFLDTETATQEQWGQSVVIVKDKLMPVVGHRTSDDVLIVQDSPSSFSTVNKNEVDNVLFIGEVSPAVLPVEVMQPPTVGTPYLMSFMGSNGQLYETNEKNNRSKFTDDKGNPVNIPLATLHKDYNKHLLDKDGNHLSKWKAQDFFNYISVVLNDIALNELSNDNLEDGLDVVRIQGLEFQNGKWVVVNQVLADKLNFLRKLTSPFTNTTQQTYAKIAIRKVPKVEKFLKTLIAQFPSNNNITNPNTLLNGLNKYLAWDKADRHIYLPIARAFNESADIPLKYKPRIVQTNIGTKDNPIHSGQATTFGEQMTLAKWRKVAGYEQSEKADERNGLTIVKGGTVGSGANTMPATTGDVYMDFGNRRQPVRLDMPYLTSAQTQLIGEMVANRMVAIFKEWSPKTKQIKSDFGTLTAITGNRSRTPDNAIVKRLLDEKISNDLAKQWGFGAFVNKESGDSSSDISYREAIEYYIPFEKRYDNEKGKYGGTANLFNLKATVKSDSISMSFTLGDRLIASRMVKEITDNFVPNQKDLSDRISTGLGGKIPLVGSKGDAVKGKPVRRHVSVKLINRTTKSTNADKFLEQYENDLLTSMSPIIPTTRRYMEWFERPVDEQKLLQKELDVPVLSDEKLSKKAERAKKLAEMKEQMGIDDITLVNKAPESVAPKRVIEIKPDVKPVTETTSDVTPKKPFLDDEYRMSELGNGVMTDYELERIKTMTGVEIVLADNLHTNGQHGKFTRDSKIVLDVQGAKGTGYHEAFESVWALAFNKKEQDELLEELWKTDYKDTELYKQIKKIYPSDKADKEYLAEKFAEYSINEESVGFLKKWFDKFVRFIKNVLGLDKTGKLFSKINSGKYYQQTKQGATTYKGIRDESRLLELADGNVLSIDTTTQLMQGFNAFFGQAYREYGETNSQMVVYKKAWKSLLERLGDSDDDSTLDLLDILMVETHPSPIVVEQYTDQTEGLYYDDTLPNAEQLTRDIIEGKNLTVMPLSALMTLEARPDKIVVIGETSGDFKRYVDQVKTYPNFTKLVNAHSEYLKRLGFDAGEMWDEVDFSKSDYGTRDSFEFSPFTSTSGQLKTKLIGIPKYVIDHTNNTFLKKNGEFVGQTNDLGLPINEEPYQLNNKLLTLLHNKPADRIFQTLWDAAYTTVDGKQVIINPAFADVLKQFGITDPTDPFKPTGKGDSIKEFNLKNEFVAQFGQSEASFRSISLLDDDVRLINQNQSAKEGFVRNQMFAAFKTNPVGIDEIARLGLSEAYTFIKNGATAKENEAFLEAIKDLILVFGKTTDQNKKEVFKKLDQSGNLNTITKLVFKYMPEQELSLFSAEGKRVYGIQKNHTLAFMVNDLTEVARQLTVEDRMKELEKRLPYMINSMTFKWVNENPVPKTVIMQAIINDGKMPVSLSIVDGLIAKDGGESTSTLSLDAKQIQSYHLFRHNQYEMVQNADRGTHTAFEVTENLLNRFVGTANNTVEQNEAQKVEWQKYMMGAVRTRFEAYKLVTQNPEYSKYGFSENFGVGKTPLGFFDKMFVGEDAILKDLETMSANEVLAKHKDAINTGLFKVFYDEQVKLEKDFYKGLTESQFAQFPDWLKIDFSNNKIELERMVRGKTIMYLEQYSLFLGHENWFKNVPDMVKRPAPYTSTKRTNPFGDSFNFWKKDLFQTQIDDKVVYSFLEAPVVNGVANEDMFAMHTIPDITHSTELDTVPKELEDLIKEQVKQNKEAKKGSTSERDLYYEGLVFEGKWVWYDKKNTTKFDIVPSLLRDTFTQDAVERGSNDITSEVHNRLRAYEEYALTDAFSVDSLSFYKETLIRNGMMTKRVYEKLNDQFVLMEKLKKVWALNPTERKKYLSEKVDGMSRLMDIVQFTYKIDKEGEERSFTLLKTQGAGQVITNFEPSQVVPMGSVIKQASHPLLASTMFRIVYDKNNNPVDIEFRKNRMDLAVQLDNLGQGKVTVPSTTKLGFIRYQDETGTVLDSPLNDKQLLTLDSKQATIHDWKHYAVQVDNTPEMKQENIQGTQQLKADSAGLFNNGVPIDVPTITGDAIDIQSVKTGKGRYLPKDKKMSTEANKAIAFTLDYADTEQRISSSGAYVKHLEGNKAQAKKLNPKTFQDTDTVWVFGHIASGQVLKEGTILNNERLQTLFDTQYKPKLNALIAAGSSVVVGEAKGIDTLTKEYLLANDYVETVMQDYSRFTKRDKTFNSYAAQASSWQGLPHSEKMKRSKIYKDIYEKEASYRAQMRKSYEKVLRDFGMVLEVKGHVKDLNMHEVEFVIKPTRDNDYIREKIADYLLKNINEERNHDNVLAAVDQIRNGERLDTVLTSPEVQQAFFSVVTKNVIRQYAAGSSLPVVPDFLWDYDSERLKGYTKVDNKINFAQMRQSLNRQLANYVETLTIFTRDGLVMKRGLDVWNEAVKLVVDHYAKTGEFGNVRLDSMLQDISVMLPDSKTLAKMLYRKGFRIPTQGFASTEGLMVTEFLPFETGGIAVTYPDIVAKTGSDYDFDKLGVKWFNWALRKGTPYLLSAEDNTQLIERYASYITNLLGVKRLNLTTDSRIVLQSLDKFDTKKHINKLVNFLLFKPNLSHLSEWTVIDKLLNQMVNTNTTQTEAIGQAILRIVGGIEDSQFANYREEVWATFVMPFTEYYNTKTEMLAEYAEETNNTLIDYYNTKALEANVMSFEAFTKQHFLNQASVREAANFQLGKEFELYQDFKRFGYLMSPIGASTMKQDLGVLRKRSKTPALLSKRRDMLSTYVNNALHNELLGGKRLVGVEALDNSFYFLSAQVGLALAVEMPLSGVFGESYDIGNLINSIGQSIAVLKGEQTTAAVDVAKEQFAKEMGLTQATANIYNYLTSAGVPFWKIAFLMNHPVIKEWRRYLELEASPIGKVAMVQDKKSAVNSLLGSVDMSFFEWEKGKQTNTDRNIKLAQIRGLLKDSKIAEDVIDTVLKKIKEGTFNAKTDLPTDIVLDKNKQYVSGISFDNKPKLLDHISVYRALTKELTINDMEDFKYDYPDTLKSNNEQEVYEALQGLSNAQVLDLFLNLEQVGRVYSNSIQNNRPDTIAVASTLRGLERQAGESDREQRLVNQTLLATTQIGEPSMVKKSFLDAVKMAELYRLPDVVIHVDINGRQVTLSSFVEGLTKSDQNLSADVVNRIANMVSGSFRAYAMANGNRDLVDKTLTLLANGTREDGGILATTLMKLRKEMANNEFMSKVTLNNGKVQFIRPSNDIGLKNRIISWWNDLLTSENEEHKKMAEYLAVSTILESGLVLTPNAFYEYMPQELYQKLVTNPLTDLIGRSTQDFVRNLIAQPKFVQYLPKVADWAYVKTTEYLPNYIWIKNSTTKYANGASITLNLKDTIIPAYDEQRDTVYDTKKGLLGKIVVSEDETKSDGNKWANQLTVGVLPTKHSKFVEGTRWTLAEVITPFPTEKVNKDWFPVEAQIAEQTIIANKLQIDLNDVLTHKNDWSAILGTFNKYQFYKDYWNFTKTKSRC